MGRKVIKLNYSKIPNSRRECELLQKKEEQRYIDALWFLQTKTGASIYILLRRGGDVGIWTLAPAEPTYRISNALT